MPFPFFPGGLILAMVVLGGAFALFGLALWALDRAVVTARTSMTSGLVAGFRGWLRDGAPDDTDEPAISDLPDAFDLPDLQQVHRR